MNRTTSFLLAGVALCLFACGGGGGSGPDPFDGPLTVPHDGSSGNLEEGSGDGSGGGGGTGAGLSSRVLDSGAYSLITSAQTTVVRNDSDWAALWLAHYGTVPPGLGMPQVGPPAVDFQTEVVIAVFLGTRLTGGYSVRIADVSPEGADGARVTVEETRPGPNCIVTQALTSPYVFVAVTRFEGAAAFDFTTVVQNCP